MSEQALPPIKEPRWQGMHHDSTAKLQPGVVEFAQNFYVLDGVWKGRLGVDQMGDQLDSAQIQGIYNFEELDGTVHIVAFCNGDMYEYDEGTDSWSKTDLSGEGITMDASQTLDFANSRGRMIVTDGVNQPWMWDGDSTFTVLSNAPIANGVVIYYDKVFFYDISGDETSFEWSDEADPVNGYDPTGNSWEFVQTDAGRVRGMAALNEALIVGKEDSLSYVRGSVNEQFQTDAVREGLSETEGSIGKDSVTILDGDVYLLTQKGPMALFKGQKLMRIYENPNQDNRLVETWEDVDRSTWDQAVAVVDTQRRHIWWAMPDDFVLVYAVDEDAWQRFKFPWTITALEEVEFTSGNEFIFIGDDSGNVYRYGKSDQHSDAGTAIERKLRSRQHGVSDLNMVKRLVETHITFNLETDLQFDLYPYVDGDMKLASPGGLLQDRGRRRYRRGFNAVGTTLGWELVVDRVDQTVEVESALTILTRVGSYADF